jgi:hypothetical protein
MTTAAWPPSSLEPGQAIFAVGEAPQYGELVVEATAEPNVEKTVTVAGAVLDRVEGAVASSLEPPEQPATIAATDIDVAVAGVMRRRTGTISRLRNPPLALRSERGFGSRLRDGYEPLRRARSMPD